MGKIKWKGSTLLAPVPPVLVSCGTIAAPNVLTIAWTGIINSEPPKTYISVRKERFSHEIIKNSGEFVINLPTTKLVKAVDYCGVKSGRKENKFETARLTPLEIDDVECPIIEESPVSLVCKVTEIIELGTHDMFLADITAVYVTDELINDAGKLKLAKAGLCSYAHGEYFAQGKKIGDFGFSVKKKKKKPQYDRRNNTQKKKKG